MTIQVPGTDAAPALTLRPWLPRDIPALVKAHADPEMRRWLLRHIEDEEQARAAIEAQEQEWTDRTRFVLAVTEAIEDAPDQDPIGSVSIRRIHKTPHAAEVGYWTAPEARGRSVAARAVEAALTWAAAEWSTEAAPVTRFELIHTVGNHASCRVAGKLGFALAQQLPAFPPKFPNPGHLHVRRSDA
ncbi:MAG TPA: GNAT family N-acetyltransferase [Actinospica sp.]|nr:GNAT family N-acetyltransferase [Actinospica sp.]